VGAATGVLPLASGVTWKDAVPEADLGRDGCEIL
jgi:hypothetical protein